MRQYNYDKINLNEMRRKNIQNGGFFNIVISQDNNVDECQ